MAKKIGEILVERGLLSQQAVTQGLDSQKFFGGRLGSLLVDLGALEEKELIEALCFQKHAKPAKGGQFKAVTKATLDLIPVKVAVRYQVIPLQRDHRRLTVAMSDPNDLLALDELQFITGCVIEPLLATERIIVNALEKFYGIERKKRDTLQFEGVRKIFQGVPPPARGDMPAKLPPLLAASEVPDLQVAVEAQAAREFWAEGGAPPPAPLKKVEGPPPPPPSGAQLLKQLPAAPTPGATTAPMAAPIAAPPPPPAPAAAPVAAAAREEVADGNALIVEEGESTALIEDQARTIEEASRRLARAEVRDDIGEVLLWCTEEIFPRSALFLFQKSRTLGWTGQGKGLTPQQVRRAVIPNEEVSVFTLVGNRTHYLGPMPDNATNQRLVADLGGPWPAGVLVIPFGVKGRPLGCFYAEDRLEDLEKVDLPLMFRLLQKAGLALEILLLRSKLLML